MHAGKKKPPVQDESEAEPIVEDEPGDEDDHQSDHGTVSEGDSESDSDSASAASSGDSGSSSSSSSRKPSSPAPPGSPAAAPAPAPARAERAREVAQRGSRNMMASLPFGTARLTPTASGWQITCGRDGHHQCTKTRSNKFGGEELVQRMLKYPSVFFAICIQHLEDPNDNDC